MSENEIHKEHRKRLRQRFLEYGLDNFDEHNALELLLFFAIPRKDTNPLAHELIDRFGSLSGIFAASQQELIQVEGVGESTALLLRLVPQLIKKSMVTKTACIKTIHNSEDAGNYLMPRFMYEEDEVVLLLCLDSQRRVISCQEMGRGVVNSVETSVRRMVETALKCKATSVILAHNHPDGVAIPSREDDAVTRQLSSAFALVGIQLADHIIVAGEDFVSYRDSGFFHMFRG